MAKTQTEIPGAERPTDAKLDVQLCTMIETKHTIAKYREEYAEAEQRAMTIMRKKKILFYVYADGEFQFPIEYVEKEVIKIAAPKKMRSDD